MSTTGELVLAALQPFELKKSGKDWCCNSPFRPGSNSHGFSLVIEASGEHGAYHDHVSGESGSLYDLAARLNIPLPETNRAIETKRGYTGIEDYARAHGVDAKVFAEAGWEEVQHAGQTALRWKVGTAYRYRLLGGKKDAPTFLWGEGYKPALYGLDRAIKLAKQHNLSALVICNGEPSTVVAQSWGIPAFCQPGGENALFPELLSELNSKWRSDIWIAMDCDDTGRRASEKIAAQLEKSIPLDMGLTERGDLADYCRLHEAGTYAALQSLTEGRTRGNTPRDSATLARDAWRNFTVANPGRILRFPFTQFHHLGGFAYSSYPKKMTGIIAPSGQGKTSFLECISDIYSTSGESGMMNGREWDDTEYHTRRVQRLTGISTEDLMNYELFVQEVEDGHVDGIYGKPLSYEQEQAYSAACDTIDKWDGRVYYCQRHLYLEDTLEEMADLITSRRRSGEQISYAIFDYAQNIVLKDVGTNRSGNYYEIVVSKIKNFTIGCNLHSWVASQVTKEGADESERDTVPSASDAHYIRDFQFNLFFSLKRIYEERFDLPNRSDGKPQRQPTDRAVAVVHKNSKGRKGEVALYTDLKVGRWIDRGWTTTRLSLTGEDL
jgi:energy-coupling factor transporter ATP-binding protein EcfA2